MLTMLGAMAAMAKREEKLLERMRAKIKKTGAGQITLDVEATQVNFVPMSTQLNNETEKAVDNSQSTRFIEPLFVKNNCHLKLIIDVIGDASEAIRGIRGRLDGRLREVLSPVGIKYRGGMSIALQSRFCRKEVMRG